MRKMSLEEIQGCCLDILRSYDAYCSENGLKYWLIGGSALGAIRHKGIIPWDDDIDVGMPRGDFERLCEAYCDNDYALLSLGRTRGYFNPFAKLCDIHTFFDEPTSANAEHGVFIDVFPIDYVCASDEAIRKAMGEKRLYNHAFVVNLDAEEYRNENLAKRLVRRILRSRHSKDDPIQLSQAITASIASEKPTERMMNIWGSWGFREVMQADWFGEGVRVPFESLVCPVPTKWDEYLTTMYGGYMTPPEGMPHYHGCAYWIDD